MERAGGPRTGELFIRRLLRVEITQYPSLVDNSDMEVCGECAHVHPPLALEKQLRADGMPLGADSAP